jgi:hypothetical protein
MRRNWLVTFVVAGLLALSVSAQADDGSIAVYLDDAGTQCEGFIVSGTTIGSVWMNLAGATAGGISGVEFRIDNSNASAYGVSFVPDPAANISLGNPLLTGVNVAWPACQAGTAGRVKIGQLIITENTVAADVSLTVRQHFTPSNEFYPCPLAVLCDDPLYTKVCLTPFNSDLWRATMNPSEGVSGVCLPVAVEQTTWTQVKSLYNH